MKSKFDIIRAYYIIAGKGEILVSLFFVLGISFLIVAEPFFYANKSMGLSMSDDQLEATILNSETSRVFPFRNGYKVEVSFQIGETKRTETIYTLDKPKIGEQVALNYGYDKNGNVGAICPEIETTYPPMFGGYYVEMSPFALVALFGCWHIISTVKRGLRKVRLIKYGETVSACFVSKKKKNWFSERGRGESEIFRIVYKYSVGNEDYTVTADARETEKNFLRQDNKMVVYDPANPSNAMFNSRVRELIEISPVKQYFIGAICLAMSFIFVGFLSSVVFVLTA